MKRSIHVRLHPSLVGAVDALAGRRRRSAFFSVAIRSHLKRRDEASRAEADDLWAPERVLWLRDAR
jgi:hypothetical protein